MAAHQSGPQSASLYVGDLSPDVTEAVLFDVFKEVGPLVSIRVCRDADCRRSLGYAYVNFQQPQDAERALETLNYQPVRGKPIRIMWSQRDPGMRKTSAGNIFIKNLHKTIDNQTLYDTFSQFGNILSCKVATDYEGNSRGYGFVHFESEESGKMAIERVNGMLLKSLQVYVGQFISRQQRLARNQAAFTNCYLKCLREDVTEDMLREYFTKYGTVTSIFCKRDKDGRPFAFVAFETHEIALEVIAGTHNNIVEEIGMPDKKVYVQRAQKKFERQDELRKQFAALQAKRIGDTQETNLYVKHLDDAVDEATLREAFDKFGDITSVKIMMDNREPPHSRGFGFVCFREKDAANRAAADMNNFMLAGKPLYVNFAQRREVRRATLEIQYAARVGQMFNGGAGGGSQPYPGSGGGQWNAGQGGPTGSGPGGAAQPPTGYGQPMAPAYYPAPPYYNSPYMGYGNPRGMMNPMPGAYPMMGGMPGAGGRPRGGPPKGGRMQRGMPGGYPRGGVPMARPPYLGGHHGAMPPPAPAAPTGVASAGVPPVGVPKPAAPQGLAAPVVEGVGAATGATPELPLSSSELTQMTREEQKNTLGERLFGRISGQHPNNAAKITGMLLEMGASETLNLLEDEKLLREKVDEALRVLQVHENKAAAPTALP